MLHVPLTLDVSSQMEGKCIIMTGTLAQSYFLLPNLWVCKPCSILRYAAYEAVFTVVCGQTRVFVARSNSFGHYLDYFWM